MDTFPLFPPVEMILGVLPGATDRDRILLAQVASPGGDDVVELRQQTFGDGVGWFTQLSIPLTGEQASALANTLKASATSVLPGKKARVAASLQKAAARGLALVR
jgi:hypothetical protein